MPERIKTLSEWQKCLPPETAGMLEICGRLTKLEKEWQSLFQGSEEALGRETSPGNCSFEDSSAVLTVHVRNAALLQSLRFKEKLFKSRVEGFLGIKIKKIEFAAGMVERISSAKPALRVFERRGVLLAAEEQVEKAKAELRETAAGETLREAIARVRVIAEKKSRQKNT